MPALNYNPIMSHIDDERPGFAEFTLEFSLFLQRNSWIDLLIANGEGGEDYHVILTT